MSAEPQSPARRRFPALVLLASLVVAGMLASCGGGDEDETSTRTFVAEADAICAEYAADTALLETRFNEALGAEDLESAATDFRDQATRVSEMLDRLAELSVPVPDQSSLDQLVELGRQRVSMAEETADAIAAGEGEAAIRLVQQAMGLSDEYQSLAQSLGFDSCRSLGQAAQP